MVRGDPTQKRPFIMKIPLFAALSLLLLPHLAFSKAEWPEHYDLERALDQAALIVAAELVHIKEVPVTFGGKGQVTQHQYTFKPMKVIKGVFSRPELVLQSTDLGGYYGGVKHEDLAVGQKRLLILGRSRVGYQNIWRGGETDQTLIPMSGPDDSLLATLVTMFGILQQQDRLELVKESVKALSAADDRGALMLLTAIQKRAFLAGQLPLAHEAVRKRLNSDSAIVREAAARTLAAMFSARYQSAPALEARSVEALVKAASRKNQRQSSQVAILKAMGAVGDAVVKSGSALALLHLDAPTRTFAELEARAAALARISRDHEINFDFIGYLEALPLDSRPNLQRHVATAAANADTKRTADLLLKRLQDKKALGLGGETEIDSMREVFERADNPVIFEKRVFVLDLTDNEKQRLLNAVQSNHADLVAPLREILKTRNKGLRRSAIDLLVKIDNQEAAEAIRPYLKSEMDLRRKLVLAKFLGQHGFDDGYPYAIEHMSEPYVREIAIEALSAMNQAGTVEELLAIYQTSNDNNWRHAAIRALGLLGDTSSLENWLNMAADPRDALAPAAIRAVAELGDPQLLGLYATGLSSRNEVVARACAHAAKSLFESGKAKSSDQGIGKALAALAIDSEASLSLRSSAFYALQAGKSKQMDAVLEVLIKDRKIEQAGLMSAVRKEIRARKLALSL
jgi:HEAT repeat protein